MKDNTNKRESENMGLIGRLSHTFGWSKEEQPFTAERCFYESINGIESYIPLEDRIRDKQEEIQRTITSKFARYGTNGELRKTAEYCCLVTITEDLVAHVEEVFKPFIEGGFEIINLSKEISDIREEYVYYISWKWAFRNKEKPVVRL